MRRNSIRWRLPVSYAVIALVAALSLGSMMLLVLRHYYADQEREYLYGNAVAVKPMLEKLVQIDMPRDKLQSQVEGLAFLSQTQIQLLDTSGRFIVDSGVPNANQVVAVSSGVPFNTMYQMPVPAEPVFGQSRVVIAFGGEASSKDSAALEKQFKPGMSTDIVIPVSASPYGYGFVQRTESDIKHRSPQRVTVMLTDSQGKKLGSMEFSNGPSYGADVIQSVTLAWLVASLFAMGIAVLTGWFMSQRVTRPVLALTEVTGRMEAGDLGVRAPQSSQMMREFTALGVSFNRMAARIEETVVTLRRFVADAAHELKTPLTALRTNLELARNESDPQRLAVCLTRAEKQVLQLDGLMNGLLDLSRLESGGTPPRVEEVDLGELLQETSEVFAARAEQTGQSFELVLPESACRVNASRAWLQQALGNLLDNALKFTPAGGSIRAGVEQCGVRACLWVEDSGMGIPEADLPQLFNRFHRGRNASGLPGSGLGLAIARVIVESQAGGIRAANRPEGGARFEIDLPGSR